MRWQVEIRTDESKAEAVTDFLTRLLHDGSSSNDVKAADSSATASHATAAGSVRVLESIAGRVRLALPKSTAERGTVQLSQLFGAIEGARVALGVRDYSISQTTLEQVCTLTCLFRHS